MPNHTAGHRIVPRCAGIALIAGVLLAAAAAPASAQISPDADAGRRIGIGNQFVRQGESIESIVLAIDGDATVAGETTERVFVVRGDAHISGRVGGDVLVIDGNARISGRVDQDVTVLSGRAILEDGAIVRGDVKSTDEPRVARGARVAGSVDEIDIVGNFTAIGFKLLGYLWVAVTLSTAILAVFLLALFRRPFEAAATTGRTDVGKSIGLGLGVAVGVPIVSVLAVVTLVGLPLGAGLLGGHGLVWALGYVTAALCLGRRIIKSPRNIFGAFFVGWGILRVVALLPGIGVLFWIGASVYGIGALVLTAWRASRPTAASPGARDTEVLAPAPTPVAVPATPEPEAD